MVNTPYDDVFRTLLNDCTELVIPVVNKIFGENYSGKEQVVTFQNELFMMRQDGDTKEKITDTCFVIINDTEEKDKKYHLECQSTPDAFTVRMVTPGGEVAYPIPVMKVQKYTIDEILQNRLLFLIPFYIFSYEKSFDRLEKNREGLAAMEEEFLRIRKQLEKMCTAGEITEYIKCTLLDMTKKVVESIARNYEAVREGVKNVVGGKILEYEAKDILRRGISQGRQEGELNMCIRLIQDGLLKVEDAARKLNMEEEELEKRL